MITLHHTTQGGCICVPRQDTSVEASHPRQCGVLDEVCVQYLRWQQPLEECVRPCPSCPPLLHLQRVHPHLHIRTRSHHNHHIRMEQLPQSHQENHSEVGDIDSSHLPSFLSSFMMRFKCSAILNIYSYCFPDSCASDQFCQSSICSHLLLTSLPFPSLLLLHTLHHHTMHCTALYGLAGVLDHPF